MIVQHLVSLYLAAVVAAGPGPFATTHSYIFWNPVADCTADASLAYIGPHFPLPNSYRNVQWTLVEADATLLSLDTQVTMGNTCTYSVSGNATFTMTRGYSHETLPLQVFTHVEPLGFFFFAPAGQQGAVQSVDPDAWDELPDHFDEVLWQWNGDPEDNVPQSLRDAFFITVDWVDCSFPDSSPDVHFDDPDAEACVGGQILVPTFVWSASSTVTFDWQCLGDVDGDGVVGFGDLKLVNANWGPTPTGCANCIYEYDIDQDGTVGQADVGYLLANWGDCSP